MNIHNVLQSIVDTWLPVLGVIGVIILLIIVARFLKKKKDN